MRFKMAAMMISVDEKLAEEVRKFPILYDKSCPDFKNKRKKEDVWGAIAKSLGLETGKEASNCFKNLRNRYSRDKRKIQSKKSGSGTDVVKEAEKQCSDLFKYLNWLDPYIKKRQTTSNLVLSSANSIQAEESDSDNDSNDVDTHISTERSITPTSNSEMESAKDDIISETTGQLKYRKKKKTEEKKVDDAELEIMKTISSRLEKKSVEKVKKEQDEDDLFCSLLATQLRQLPSRDKLKVKMQINNIIYNCLMVPTETTTVTSPFQATLQTPLSNVMQHDFYNAPNVPSRQFQIPPDYLGETRQYFAPGHFFNNHT